MGQVADNRVSSSDAHRSGNTQSEVWATPCQIPSVHERRVGDGTHGYTLEE